MVGIAPDTVLRIEVANPEANPNMAPDLPSLVTARDLAELYLALHGVPRRSFFELLMKFCDDEEHKERLEYFGSAEASECGDFQVYCSKERRSYVEVMSDFNLARPPLEHLLDVIPRLQPRQFSIASSPSRHPGVIQLCIAIVSFQTPTKRTREGCCTNWLKSLPQGATVPLWVRRNPAMRLPANPEAPLIMVGPGTGVAPLRAMLHERQMALAAGGAQTTTHRLFFGCRKRSCDYLYGDEFEAMAAQGLLKDFDPAFSRDEDQKVYVQHKIRKHAQTLWQELSDPQCHFYLCGAAGQMPREVREELIDAVCVGVGEMQEDEANALLTKMEKEKRFHVETWS